jgi:hypothetical protein
MRNLKSRNTAYLSLNKQIKVLTAFERYGCDWKCVSKFLGITVLKAKTYYIIVNQICDREEREERKAREELNSDAKQKDAQESEDRVSTRSVGVQYGEGVYLPGWHRSLI